jgi:DNA-binding MarR family transcriptional regulator
MDRWLQKALFLVEEILSSAAQITRIRNALMRDFGLDRQRWSILLAVSRSDYCLSISDLARVLKQSRQATHRMAVELARAGWLELLPNPDDRRIIQLELTRAGKSVIGQIRHRFTHSVLQPSAHLEGRDIQTATEVLSSLRTRMGAFAEEHKADLKSPLRRGYR